MFCNKCEPAVSPDSNFCAKCGSQVVSSAPPPTRSVTSSAAVNTNVEIGLTEVYETFVGPAKARYYVPIFERLDSGASATPFEGIGKPEPLRHGLKGFWSRRISDEHRLVYKVQDDALLIAQCRNRY